MNVVKQRGQRRTEGYTISQLLSLGVPRSLLYVKRQRSNGSFWTRKINHLAVLEKARQLYREKLVREHPDKGGCHNRMSDLNSVWSTIKRRFNQHGYEI
jgi:hypothetical protein